MAQTMDRDRCEECGLNFDSEEELRRHERTYHAEGRQQASAPEQGQGDQQHPYSERGTGTEPHTRSEFEQEGSHKQPRRQEPGPKRKAS